MRIFFVTFLQDRNVLRGRKLYLVVIKHEYIVIYPVPRFSDSSVDVVRALFVHCPIDAVFLPSETDTHVSTGSTSYVLHTIYPAYSYVVLGICLDCVLKRKIAYSGY